MTIRKKEKRLPKQSRLKERIAQGDPISASQIASLQDKRRCSKQLHTQDIIQQKQRKTI